jgi:hypothetical protein
MFNPSSSERRQNAVDATGVRQCPWCKGRLDYNSSFPLRLLIPGEIRDRSELNVPESLRTVRAWVCATPHCKFRETA